MKKVLAITAVPDEPESETSRIIYTKYKPLVHFRSRVRRSFKASVWNSLKTFNWLVNQSRQRKHVFPTQHIYPAFVRAAGKSVDVVGFLKTQNDLWSHAGPLPYIDVSIKPNVFFYWIFNTLERRTDDGAFLKINNSVCVKLRTKGLWCLMGVL